MSSQQTDSLDNDSSTPGVIGANHSLVTDRNNLTKVLKEFSTSLREKVLLMVHGNLTTKTLFPIYKHISTQLNH